MNDDGGGSSLPVLDPAVGQECCAGEGDDDDQPYGQEVEQGALQVASEAPAGAALDRAAKATPVVVVEVRGSSVVSIMGCVLWG